MSDSKIKTLSINNLLGASLINMIREMPTSPTIRAQVHAAVRFPIPEDKTTFLQIKEWLECDLQALRDKTKIVLADLSPFEENPVYVPAIGYERDGDFESISQTVRYRYTEIGTARYTENRVGVGEYEVEGNSVEEYFQSCRQNGWDLDRFVGMIKESLEENCMEEGPDTEPESEEEPRDYDRHESCDSTNHRASVTSMENLRRMCIDWVEANHYEERGVFGIP